jgi:hypothetical protein
MWLAVKATTPLQGEEREREGSWVDSDSTDGTPDDQRSVDLVGGVVNVVNVRSTKCTKCPVWRCKI